MSMTNIKRHKKRRGERIGSIFLTFHNVRGNFFFKFKHGSHKVQIYHMMSKWVVAVTLLIKNFSVMW